MKHKREDEHAEDLDVFRTEMLWWKLSGKVVQGGDSGKTKIQTWKHHVADIAGKDLVQVDLHTQTRLKNNHSRMAL